MKQRIITALVAVAILIPALIFSEYLAVWLPLCTLLSAIAVYEMQKCIGTWKKIPLSICAMAYGIGMPLLAAFANDYMKWAFSASFLLLILSFLCAVFSRGKITAVQGVMSAMTSMYLGVGFASFVAIRYMAGGAQLYLLIFLIPWITDTAAYFCGVTMGKHKLIPDVSPKKSVEGAIGGVVFAVLFTLGYIFIYQRFFDGFSGANYLIWGIGAAILSALSQCGDLIASLIKRQFSIKDYGNLFPGHGGVMDRFDSVILCAECFYFLLALQFFTILM